MASQIEQPDEYVYYFGLYLVQKEDDGDNSSKYPSVSDNSSKYPSDSDSSSKYTSDSDSSSKYPLDSDSSSKYPSDSDNSSKYMYNISMRSRRFFSKFLHYLDNHNKYSNF